MRRIRSHLTFANAMSLVAVFIALGGAAYAANTVSSSDIVNDQVYSADVRNDGLSGGGLAAQDLQAGAVGTSEVLNDTVAGGGLAAADLRSGSVGPAEAAGLTGADIANAAGGSDNVNADKLDGLDSSGLVQGRGTLLSNRVVSVPGPNPPKTLLVVPGLGELQAHCFSSEARVIWKNTTTDHLDVWIQRADGGWGSGVVPPAEDPLLDVSFVTNSDANSGGTISLGLGNDPGARRVALIHAFSFQSADGFPCGFQAQGTLWTSE